MRNFSVNYIVQEDKGIVVCTISDCEFNAVALVDNYVDVPPCVPDTFVLSKQYKGVAKCMPEDTFDVEYGKRLAYRKAYVKYITALEKKVKLIAEEYKKYSQGMIKLFDKAVSKIDGKTENAIKLYNEVLEENE